MKKVMVFGTFDGLHEGHLNFFEQAKAHGDFLVVVVGRDNNVLKFKKHLPKKNEVERLNGIKDCRLANEVLLGHKTDHYKIIKEIKPDVICLGYDQHLPMSNLEEKLKESGLATKIYTMKAFEPEKYHSSILNKN